MPPVTPSAERPRRIRDRVFRIWTRLVLVNLLVVLVPVAGLEFARIYERQLLGSHERNLRNQAFAIRTLAEQSWNSGNKIASVSVVIGRFAERTDARIRVMSKNTVVYDTKNRIQMPRHYPNARQVASEWTARGSARSSAQTSAALETLRATPTISVETDPPGWPKPLSRSEVVGALEGAPSAFTRVHPNVRGVVLAVTEPVVVDGAVVGAVLVEGSTLPVMVELYRIRKGLMQLLAVAFALTITITFLLAVTISNPLNKLSKAARRIAAGERPVEVPQVGSGEIRELSNSLSVMAARLDERLQYARDFAADVAHEFKSPLTSIRGAAELLADGALRDETSATRFLSNIQLDVERLDRLVSRLLELGRVESADAVRLPADVVQLVTRAAERCATDTVAVQVTSTAPSAIAAVRAPDIESLVANLVGNAVRFSVPGQAVRVHIEAADPLVVTVSDAGPGISEAHQAHLFERFFTTDTARNGTGLGLAIARVVARSHGGELELLTSSPAHGTTFRFWFHRF